MSLEKFNNFNTSDEVTKVMKAARVMKAMGATSCVSHRVYCEICVARSDIVCNHVFTLTLYVILQRSLLSD